MATARSCSMCEKGTGTYFCTGCEAYFCMKDLKIHHGELLNQLDTLIEERNIFQEKMNTSTQSTHLASPRLVQIDEWQKMIIERVKKAAEQARRQVLDVLVSKQAEMKVRLDKLSQELRRLKETEDFAENDLNRLKQTMRQLNQDMKHAAEVSTMKLNVENSDVIAWNHLIYGEKNTAYNSNQLHADKTTDQLQRRKSSASTAQDPIDEKYADPQKYSLRLIRNSFFPTGK